MHTEKIEIDGIQYLLKIHVEKRNDVRASLRGGNINIRIPSFLGKKRRTQYISRTLNDVRKKIHENPELKPRAKVFRKYRNGEVLVVGRDEYLLEIESKNILRSTGRMDGNVIRINIAEGLGDEEEHRQVSSLISRCVAEDKRPALEAHIRELNEKYFQQNIKSVRLKNNKTNWGSCSKRGNINLSTRLLFAPDDVIEYVCIHELAHLVELNHSDRFWKLVESVAPDYREKKMWLKNNSSKFQF